MYAHEPPHFSSGLGQSEQKKIVLVKALANVTQRLGLTRKELSAVIGHSESSLSRLFSRSACTLDPASKEGQLAILLLRLYRSLDVLFGGNAAQCQLWLRAENDYLHAIPIVYIQSIEGLVAVVQYLDAMCGKN